MEEQKMAATAATPTPTPPSTSPAGAPASGNREDVKTFACVACTQRKVKCDKRHPCLSCSKSRLDCQYRALPPPQRRKRRLESVNDALVQRLHTYETLLRNAGLPTQPSAEYDAASSGRPESLPGIATLEDGRGEQTDTARWADGQQIERPPSLRPRHGLLVTEYGGRRYYEYGLLGAMAKDFKQDIADRGRPQSYSGSPSSWSGASQRESGDGLALHVLAGNRVSNSHTVAFPSPKVIAIYWTLFLNNVHPLTKVIHAPTMQNRFFEEESAPSAGLDALKLSIFACAVASTTEQECLANLGESRMSLLPRLQTTAQTALLSTSFGSVPDLELLRAYVLLTTSMLETSEPASLWVLMGSAIRIAQTQGVHRDVAALGLSPFETEMRRRLWWYLLTLDGRLAELTGARSGLPQIMDNALPLNVNDADLDPEMSKPPKERIGATEMTYCLLKYEVTRFLHEYDPWTSKIIPRPVRYTRHQSLPELENILEDNFLRFCDPIISVQMLTTVIGRSTICKLRQMSQLRIRPGSENAPAPTAEAIQMRNRHLELAMRNIEYDNLIHANRSLTGFLWHVHFFFPWGAPVAILQILTSCPQWDDTLQTAWDRIADFHHHHPEFLRTESPIHLLVGRMTINAWTARDAFLRSKGVVPARPEFVASLQNTQDWFWSMHSKTGQNGLVNRMPGAGVPMLSDDLRYAAGGDDFALSNFDLFDPMFFGAADWAQDWSSGYHV